MATMQALACWRLTQGVYRFSPDLYQSLCATALDEKLPIDLQNEIDRLLAKTKDFISIQLIQDAVNLTLYLCSEAPDLSGTTPPAPRPKKTKKGLRYFPAKSPATMDVGYRVSKYLHQVKEVGQGHGIQGDRSSPIPHIRRAHWHTFWTGPRRDPVKRLPVLRWIPPTPVGFRWDEVGEKLVPTVKEVQNDENT